MKYLLAAWRWLTAMRTALALLFVLAIASVPGALLPQRSLNETKVDEYIAANGTAAEIMDTMQLFDIFSAPWYIGIALLLTLSLIGCIIPRTWDHYKVSRTDPVRAPRYLDRLPRSAAGDVGADLATVRARVEERFTGWRTRWYTPEEDRAGALTLSAEKGYTREWANLVFHLGIVGILATVGWGAMVTTESNTIVVVAEEDNLFCNTAVANFDSFDAGPLIDGTNLDPFCVNIKDFTADYHPNGQAEQFSSHVTYSADPLAPLDQWTPAEISVNHPLRVSQSRVYLQGHGYAPTFTVIWPNGEERSQTLQFRPDDPQNFLSTGAMRFDPPAGMYPDDFERRRHQISVQGLFAPTAAWNGELLSSGFPTLTDPAVAIDIYRGDNGLDAGTGQSIFSLDATQIASGELQKIARVNLAQGESITLDDGTVVRFEGAKEFVNLQVGTDPSQVWVLVFTIIMLVGMAGSLSIKRRRIWIRLTPTAAGTHLEMGGLARTDKAGWGDELDDIFAELTH